MLIGDINNRVVMNRCLITGLWRFEWGVVVGRGHFALDKTLWSLYGTVTSMSGNYLRMIRWTWWWIEGGGGFGEL